jgi:hypothetical protein
MCTATANRPHTPREDAQFTVPANLTQLKHTIHETSVTHPEFKKNAAVVSPWHCLHIAKTPRHSSSSAHDLCIEILARYWCAASIAH